MRKFINYSEIEDDERNAMCKNTIPFRKFQSQLLSKSRKDSKLKKCFYCGCETTKFCNSHTLPAFILRNIALDGKLYTVNKVLDCPLFEKESGINSSGTFQLICRDCDSKIFADYENPDNYHSAPTSLMVAQMAMKNYLRQIGKRRGERSLYTNMHNEFLPVLGQHLEVIDLDLKEYRNGYKKAKKAFLKDWGNEFFLFFCEKLDYVVPIAFQGLLTPLVGLRGELINNVFDKSVKNKMQFLHVSIFL